jgi:AraC-like DNA-binding protein
MGVTTVHTPLFAGPIIQVHRIEWSAEDSRPGSEYVSPWPEITFMTRGMFLKSGSDHSGMGDPNTLVFFNHQEAYQMRHPVPGQCACTALLISPEVLSELTAKHRPIPRDSRRLFPFAECPGDPELVTLHYDLLGLLHEDPRDLLAIEEKGMELLRRTVDASFGFHRDRRRPRRTGTRLEHSRMARAVRELLASHYREALSLAEIAGLVGQTPNYVCDVFKRETGLTVHQYLTRLRLAAAMERLPDRRRSLSTLALELGFAHHSHFTAAFRRAFGMPPSRLTPPRPRPLRQKP